MVLTEATLEEALDVFGPNFLVISAAKTDRTEEQNRARNAVLREELESAGYSPEPATGHYTYDDGTAVYEDSYVALYVPERLKHKLGEQFGQETILDEHGLHFVQKGTTAPFASSGHHLGESARAQPSWLEYPLGRNAIAFAIDFEAEKQMANLKNKILGIALSKEQKRALDTEYLKEHDPKFKEYTAERQAYDKTVADDFDAPNFPCYRCWLNQHGSCSFATGFGEPCDCECNEGEVQIWLNYLK